MRVAILLLSIASLASIGVGACWIYPPAGPLAVGLLIWIELMRTTTPRRDKK